MTTDKVFGTVFETSLRILLLLDESDADLDEQTIRAADFISTYGKEFDVAKSSLNGDNPYMYCELASRKTLVFEAIKRLVIKGYVLPVATDEGFFYRTTLPGHKYARSLKSSYAQEYRDAATQSLLLIRDSPTNLIQTFVEPQDQ